MPKYQVMIDDVVSSRFFSFDELIDEGLLDDYDVSIKIRSVNELQWCVARDYPFAEKETSANSLCLNEDDSITRNVISMANYSLNEDGTVNRSEGYDRPQRPDSNMVWAIISISICLPFGILALVESVKVDSLYSIGDYNGAQRASESAKKWAMWSIYIWLILFAFIVIIAIANSK